MGHDECDTGDGDKHGDHYDDGSAGFVFRGLVPPALHLLLVLCIM